MNFSFGLLNTLVLIFTINAHADLNQYLDNFSQFSHNLKQKQSESNSLKHQIRETKGSLYPKIDFNISKMSYKNLQGIPGSNDRYSATLDLVQPIYTGGSLYYGVEYAKIQLQTADLELEVTKEKTRMQAIGYLLNLLPLLEAKKIANSQLQTAERNLKIITRKQKLGNARIYELNQAKAEQLARRISAREAQIQLDNFKKEILSQIEQAEAIQYINKIISSNWDAKDLKNKLDTFESKALALNFDAIRLHNRDLKAMELARKTLDTGHKVDLGSDNPSLQLVASSGYSSNTTDTWFDSGKETHTLTLAAKVPLFSGLSSVFKKKAYHESSLALEQQKLELHRSIKLAFENTKKEILKRKELLALNKDWLKEADESLAKASKSYRNGQINFLQLSQIQQSLDAASRQYWAAWAEYYQMLLELGYLGAIKIP